jgi:hypothetical protein
VTLYDAVSDKSYSRIVGIRPVPRLPATGGVTSSQQPLRIHDTHTHTYTHTHMQCLLRRAMLL